MKKYISYMLIFIIVFTLIGCTKQKAENVREKDRFDIKVANNIVESYIKNITAEKYNEANDLVSERVKTDVKDIKPNDLKIKGFRTEEMTESSGEGNFRVNVVKSNVNKPETQVIEYRFKVIKDGIDYKIDEIKTSLFREAFQSFDEIRLRKEQDLDTLLITAMEGLPKYAYSKDDNAKMKSQLVPKGNFGVITLNYTGSTIAITTTGEDTYIGILAFDDSMETQGQNKGGGQGGGQQGDGGANGQQDGNQKGKMPKEKPIGKQLLSCDVMQKTTVEDMIFSKDEKTLAIQYQKEGKRSIRVYNIGSGELIKFKFEEEYPLNKVDVILKGFEKDTMKYTVVPKGEQKDVSEYVGNWEMDLKEFKAKKLKG
ncbi:hypothetical protein GOM49_17130 [Clostridium bovifaecis]|uniref:Uncharacterized protein n=1 Tax=Clostridium bovifaecis TaxID=2184719 RepID=A0A6I6F211_9CLOT|nr:hypothetical protein GOM49_17130 [Clostridium bovifaecis]